MFLLNRLEHEINRSDTGLEDTQRAVSAVLEKILSDTAESKVTPHLAETSNSTADILIQMLSDPVVAERVNEVLDAFEDAYHTGLLAELDRPQMMTPLWNHQRDAIEEWLAAGSSGYVDMATATGKTVLGLAAIAVHYGSLHTVDADIDRSKESDASKSDILVVAHNDLILEQWRREFDRHLNIPPDRTHGSDPVDLTWGRVHFKTAQTLVNADRIEYDLVILDEAHHYASGTGWGQLLEEFDNNVLALSGSVDTDSQESSTVRERLEAKLGPECKRYTLAQAQRDGVIPTFDWSVEYTEAAGDDTQFREITERAKSSFRTFQNRLEDGTLDVDSDRRLRTFDDIRKFSHTTEGKSLKQSDDQFRDFVTTLFSRRTQRWNQSPDPDAVADIVAREVNRKIVVLTNNNAQIDAIVDTLRDRSRISDSTNVYSVTSGQSSQEQRNTVDRFDTPGEPAVLIGTGDLLGEGVDMQHAEVGINMATGSVNKQLIQRIGRVLRNPGTDKQVRFVNMVGVPTERDVQIPVEDGQSLVEDAQQFKQFGDSFDNDPVFTVGERADLAGIKRLFEGGYKRITTLDEEGLYEWPESEAQRETLKQLLAAISDEQDPEAVLLSWSPDDRDTDRGTGSSRPGELVLKVLDSGDRPVEDAFVSLSGDTTATFDRTDDGGEVRFFDVNQECIASIHTPDGGIRTVQVSIENSQATNFTVNVKSALQS
ncbi:DEAD/DEAH box helicase family protein [Halobacteriaceae archaeon SHR40]|uniref:DEAD/DEAH box helicase n=1 Tax=Halovenus amylolytica TaxID=2500550 RepID=UPI0012603662